MDAVGEHPKSDILRRVMRNAHVAGNDIHRDVLPGSAPDLLDVLRRLKNENHAADLRSRPSEYFD